MNHEKPMKTLLMRLRHRNVNGLVLEALLTALDQDPRLSRVPFPGGLHFYRLRSDTQCVAYVGMNDKTIRFAYNGPAMHALLTEAYAKAATEAPSRPTVVWEPILDTHQTPSPA